MIQSLSTKKIIILLLLIATASSFLLLSAPVQALCTEGINKDQCPAAGIIQAQQLLTRMINISVTLAFMAVTVWLAWSAIKFFITSGGDPKALAQAWSSLTWTFMGLVFMILAYLAIKLVVSFTGAPVNQYCLGFPPYCL